MDPALIQAIASGVVVTLTSAVIKLMNASASPIKAVGQELIETLGQTVGERAAGLMKTLVNKFKGNPAAEAAVADFVETPEDEDVQAALRHQLKKMLKDDEAFAQKLHKLLQADNEVSPHTGVRASGERSVATGRDVNAPIFTGDIKGDINIGN